jgi:hypothetical protein
MTASLQRPLRQSMREHVMAGGVPVVVVRAPGRRHPGRLPVQQGMASARQAPALKRAMRLLHNMVLPPLFERVHGLCPRP